MLLQSTLLVLLHLVLRVAAQNDCTSLLSLSLPNATVTNATRVVAGTNFTASADPSCYIPTWINSVDICRVIGVVTTSPTSSVEFEMWLPDTWYGRLLASGNSGLGGCTLLYIIRRSRFSLLITGFFFDFQASHTQLSTAVLTSTSPQSEQTAGIVEPLTQPRSSYHLTPRTSSTLPIAQCTCLSESENKSPRVTTALRHIIRITTGVRPEGEKGLPLRRSTLKTLTAFLRGPPPLIGITLWVLMGSGPLILPPTHPAPSRHPFGAQSLRRKFSANAMGSMER